MRKYREVSTMKEIQKSILTYIESNKYSAPLLKIAGVMALVAPIYMVVSRIYFLHSVWNIIEIFYVYSLNQITILSYYFFWKDEFNIHKNVYLGYIILF